MAVPGSKTTNLTKTSALDEIIGNVDPTGVARQSFSDFATQLSGTGAFVYGNSVAVATVEDLNAATPPSETAGGMVLADQERAGGSAANNGHYVQTAPGVWEKKRGFPDTVALVSLDGSVDANAQTGTVSQSVDPATVQMFIGFVTTSNTTAMTLNLPTVGEKPVVNAAGNALSGGEWTGIVTFVVNGADQYQLVNDAGASASAAQSASDAGNSAALATSEADRAATNAQSVVARAWFKTVAEVLADNNTLIGYTASGASFEVAAGDEITAQGFRYEVAASGAGDQHVTTTGGVKLYLLGTVLSPFQIGAVADGSDEGPLLQALFNIGRSVDIAGGNFVTHQQLILAARGQKIFNSNYELGAGSITAGAAMASVIRIDNHWIEIESIGIQGGTDSATRYATHGVLYYNGARATLRKCDILYAIDDGVYFDLDATAPQGNNNLARVIQCDIRSNGRDGINIPRKGPAEGDQNGITILLCNIRSNGRHGIYTDAMGTFIDFCHIESNAQSEAGYAIYVEPTFRGTTQVLPAIGPHNWLENGGNANIYGWGSMQWAQTGAAELRSLNGAPVKGNVSRNVTFRHAQDTASTNINADGHFCDIWRVISNGASFSLSRVNPDASLGRDGFGGAPFAAELNIGSFGSSSFLIGQALPDVSTFAGQGITVSFWVQAPAGDLCFIRAEQNFGSGGSASVLIDEDVILSTHGGGRLPAHVNLIIPPIDGKTIGANSFFSIYLHIANTKSTGIYRFSGFDIRSGMTPPPMMEIPDYGDERARLQQMYWRNDTLRWQGYTHNGAVYAAPVALPNMIRTPTITLSGISQANFPSGAPGQEDVTPRGFYATKTADADGVGNFRFSAIANARL